MCIRDSTVGAMAGAFAGAYHGESGLPYRWVSDIEFPSGLEGAADEILALTGLGPVPTPPDNPAPDEYAPVVVDGRRWITRIHSDSAALQPDEAHDIRLMPHPSACLLYTSDAADDLTRVYLGGRRL